jgi:hypothetical protein
MADLRVLHPLRGRFAENPEVCGRLYFVLKVRMVDQSLHSALALQAWTCQ